jgi:serine/threonine protein kinase
MNDPARASADRGTGALAPGTLLANRFRIKEVLGPEGETQVYRASDATSGSDVLVRLIRVAGPGRAALERELGKAQRLPHKNLSTILGVASHGELLLVAAELEEGHTLRQVVDAQRAQGRPIGPESANTLLGHVGAALEHARAGGMAHGGLNPQAIWLTPGGRVKVSELGFGVVLPQLARRGGPAGAPGGLYLAPEVARGTPPTPASDVYSLGAILFELVTGAPPAPPLQPPSRMVAGLSPALDAVVGRALLPSPQGRFPYVVDMLRALAAAVGAPSEAPRTPEPVPVAGTAARNTAGRSFNVAAAAGLSQEEARWLVQKDKLDFGPFSLQQVMAQIEQGAFRSDDLIVDMDSGARQKVKDHPQLGEFARAAERRLEQTRRAQAEQATETVERKKSRFTTFIIGAAVLVLGTGLGLYLKNRKAAEEGELASRVGEADIDAFLKGVKIDFPKKERSTRRAARGGGGGKDDPFNSVTNLGDVSSGDSEQILSDNVIQGVMMANYRKLVPCVMDERRRSPGLAEMDLEFVVSGGKVAAVKVNGQRSGAFPGCLLQRMQSFGFPKSGKTIASWSMAMR